jgi:hypothetical protein
MIDGRLEAAARMGMNVMMAMVVAMVVVRHKTDPMLLTGCDASPPYIVSGGHISPK